MIKVFLILKNILNGLVKLGNYGGVNSMPVYRVQTTANIFYSEDITAETPELAAENADYPHVCHHCSSNQDVSDPFIVEVFDSEGELVYEDNW